MIDALMLLGENRFGPSVTVDRALGLMDELALDTIVAAPARPSGYHLEPANDTLAKAADASAGRLVPLGRVDPLEGERALAEAERCVRDLGCAGLFVHPGEEAFPVRRATEVFRVAAGMGVPVVVATGFFALSEPLQVAEIARQVPGIPVILTTGGQINVSGLSLVDAWLALTTTTNLHVMTNGEYRQDFIERLATELDPRRLLFASFAPAFDPAFEQARIQSARLDETARRLVEHDNAERIFRRRGRPAR